MDFPEKIVTPMITSEQLRKRVAELGLEITKDFQNKDLTVVGLLKGSAIFTADLVRAIELPLILDFMSITSYSGTINTSPTGVVKILKDLDTDIEGRDLLVVEDIVDTGLTLNYLTKILRAHSPASLTLCTLLDRTVRRIIDLPIAYRGFEIPDVYVVGYGLDHQQRYRNLPFIGTLKEP
ncbi:MAG: hypoxanthine phosphoribosyltransferase [Acidobacteriota bacterium]